MKRMLLAVVLLLLPGFAGAQQYGYLPIYTTATLPACTTEHIWRLVYNTTESRFQKCDGASWVPASTVAWGALVGTIGDQTDLGSALGAKVPTGRLVSTTAPLAGGGDLSGDRTLTVATFGSGAAGVVPASGGGTANFLRADGGWVAPPGGGSTPTGTGFRHVTAGAEDAASVLVTLTSAVHVAANQGTTTQTLHGNAAGQASFGAVALGTDVSGDLPLSSLAQAGAISKLLGRGSAAGAGDFEEITLGTNLSMSGTTLNAAAGGGSANVVSVDVDFGTAGQADARTVVTGQAWVTGTSKIVCVPTLFATTGRVDGTEDALIEGLRASVYARSAGVGFSVMAAVARGFGRGVYNLSCTGS